MNRYFDKNDNFNSNSRIFNAYYNAEGTQIESPSVAFKNAKTKLAGARRSALIGRILRVAKPIIFSVSLLGILGVASAIEAGTLGLGSGLAIAVALLGVEYLCLRRRRA